MMHPPFPAISLNYFRYTDSSAALSHRLLSSRFAPDCQALFLTSLLPQLRLHEPFLVPRCQHTEPSCSIVFLLHTCRQTPDSDGPECQSSPCPQLGHTVICLIMVGHKDIVSPFTIKYDYGEYRSLYILSCVLLCVFLKLNS